MNRRDGCGLHGWAYTHGCPGCEAAEDEQLLHGMRWTLRRMDWFPYRVAEFKGMVDEWDMDLGPWRWVPPHRGPIRWLMMKLRRSS